MKSSSLILFCLYPFFLSAMPKGSVIKHGTGEFTTKDNTLLIQVSDKAIVHFESFDIHSHETVEFVQPHRHATVLNRIHSDQPSAILGTLKANGALFLVNPRGVYFGKESSVDVGSLIATTMNIFDDDFKRGEFAFFEEKGGDQGKIFNEGTLTASPEGAIILLSAHIENGGTIQADVGKVILASAEMITVDFSGDGLISFAIDNAKAQWHEPQIRYDIKDAGCVVKEVINVEGIEEGNCLIEEHGIIRLTAESILSAKEIIVKAQEVEAEGKLISSQEVTLVASKKISLRDEVDKPLILESGQDIVLKSAHIEINAWQHPATRLSSGGNMLFMSDNPIAADAKFYCGGNFSLTTVEGKPADLMSTVDPIVTAIGSVSFGAYTGPSLKVEAGGDITSSGNITITGPDTMACTPSGCMSDPDCVTLSTEVALILIAGTPPASPSCNPVPVTFSGTSFSSAPGTGSTITLGGTISGSPNPLTTLKLTGNVALSASTTLISNAGITINGSIDGAFPLTLTGGAGTIAVTGPIGSTIPLDGFTVNSISGSSPFPALLLYDLTSEFFNAMTSGITTGSVVLTNSNFESNLNVSNGSITFNGPITDSNSRMFINGTGVANITFNGNVTLSESTAQLSVSGTNLYLNKNIVTNDGKVNLTATTTFLAGSILTFGGNIAITSQVIVESNLTILDSSPIGAITITNTINGDTAGRGLLISTGTGTLTLQADIGNTVPLSLFVADAATIDFQANFYNANRQLYVGDFFNFSAPGLLTLESLTEGIIFKTGTVQLTGGGNLLVETNDGPFAFASMTASTPENINILAGSGTVTLGQMTMINNVFVEAGQIFLNGPITVNDLSLTSETSITNLGSPFTVTTTANALFNALGGTVGTMSSPIAVNATFIVIAGAPQEIAAFTGTTADDTIHAVPNNVPCPLLFNGTVLISCPVITPFPRIPARDFYVPEIYSQYNSLASDFYFLPEIVDASFVALRKNPLFRTYGFYPILTEVKTFFQTQEKSHYRI